MNIMPAYSILTVNIEGDNHLEKVQKLISDVQPDILCLQEVYKEDLPLFENQLQVRAFFIPQSRVESENSYRLTPKGEWGIAILCKKQLLSVRYHSYFGDLSHVPLYDNDDPNVGIRALLIGEVKDGDSYFFFATTHFTWTNNGAVSDMQHEHMDLMLEILKPYTPLVLAGDFNAPRGKSVFARLSANYTDNIPKEVTTTIDQTLHRVPGIQFVVDGMFTTPEIEVHETQVIGGVSDHQAILSTFSVRTS